MNKEKVMDCFNTILEITEDFNMPSTNWRSNTLVVRHKAKEGISELNAKPVMPKIFDDWYKQAIKVKSEYSKDLVSIYAGLANVYLDSQWVDKGSKDMVNWLKHDDNRYLKCIDAIRYGYEVEK